MESGITSRVDGSPVTVSVPDQTQHIRSAELVGLTMKYQSPVESLPETSVLAFMTRFPRGLELRVGFFRQVVSCTALTVTPGSGVVVGAASVGSVSVSTVAAGVDVSVADGSLVGVWVGVAEGSSVADGNTVGEMVDVAVASAVGINSNPLSPRTG